MAGRQVTIQFLGDAKGLIAASNAAGRSTSTLGSKFKNLGKIAAVGVAAGTAVAARALWSMTEAAAADDVAQRKLALTLRNATKATDGQIASTEKWITEQGKLLGVTDDDLRPALSKLAVATGDLTQAQDLASLAMDVAAGSGKSLDAVTTALQKGVNGSVGGLSRLGVATKDASGETLTLEQITGKLAKTYKGAAADSADTASGKFNRLKVNMSELGEEIGYKVLPYASEFGEWLLDKGIPAAEDLAGWVGDNLGPAMADLADLFRENKDELQGFAEGAGKTAVGVLGDLTDLAGKAVDFFTALPSPVQNLGVKAAVAAIVLPRVAAGITSVGVSAVAAGTQLRGFTTGLATANTSGGRLGKGLLTLAGVGGMVAISEGSKEGSEAVGVLGSALTGAFVGGTIGSAIPVIGTGIGALAGAGIGASVGLWRMNRATHASAGSAEDAAVAATDYADTLDQVTGAATRATRAEVLKRLEETNLIGTAQDLGIATSTLIDATLGNKKAIGEVNKAYRAQSGTLESLAAHDLKTWLRDQGIEFRGRRRDVRDYNAILDGTDKVMQKVGSKRPKTGEWTRRLGEDLEGARARAKAKTDTMGVYLNAVGSGNPNFAPYKTNLTADLKATTALVNHYVNMMTSTLNSLFGEGHPPGGQGRNPNAPRKPPSSGKTAATVGRTPAGGGMRGGNQPIVIQFVTQGGKVIEQKLIQYSRETGRPIQVRTL